MSTKKKQTMGPKTENKRPDWKGMIDANGHAEIPHGITEIDEEAFQNCERLVSVAIPEGVTDIEDYAFARCKNLKKVVLPKSLRRLWCGPFRGCTSLRKIDLPENLEEINPSAFMESGLQSVKIPKCVYYIDVQAFAACPKLKEIFVEDGNEAFLSHEGALLTKDGCVLMAYPAEKKGPYEIPATVKCLAYSAFQGCAGLTAITIPEGVEGIDNYAFKGCRALKSVRLPKSLTQWGLQVFADTPKLKSVTVAKGNEEILVKDGVIFAAGGAKLCECIRPVKGAYAIPKGVTEIYEHAFENCGKMTSVVLPEGLKTIEWYAFWGCASLKKLVIPESVREIGEYAFCNCSSLKTIVLPDSVREVGKHSFAGCDNLTQIPRARYRYECGNNDTKERD